MYYPPDSGFPILRTDSLAELTLKLCGTGRECYADANCTTPRPCSCGASQTPWLKKRNVEEDDGDHCDGAPIHGLCASKCESPRRT